MPSVAFLELVKMKSDFRVNFFFNEDANDQLASVRV